MTSQRLHHCQIDLGGRSPRSVAPVYSDLADLRMANLQGTIRFYVTNMLDTVVTLMPFGSEFEQPSDERQMYLMEGHVHQVPAREKASVLVRLADSGFDWMGLKGTPVNPPTGGVWQVKATYQGWRG